MSVVIIGGNDCMHRRYIQTCEKYGCKAKVFTQMESEIRRKIGSPDLMILFTSTVSHKMVKCALCEAKRCCTRVERCHSSSMTALEGILKNHCVAAGEPA